MGGNRVSRPRWFFNIFVVWFCTGFWHGADWNFIVWGLYFALLLLAEKLWLLKALDKAKIFSRVYVLLLVIIGFVIFNAPSLKDAFSVIGGMFGAGGIPLCGVESLYYLKGNGLLFVIAFIGCTPLPKRLLQLLGGRRVSGLLRPAACLMLLAVCTAYLVDGSFNPFLYFRF